MMKIVVTSGNGRGWMSNNKRQVLARTTSRSKDQPYGTDRGFENWLNRERLTVYSTGTFGHVFQRCQIIIMKHSVNVLMLRLSQ